MPDENKFNEVTLPDSGKIVRLKKYLTANERNELRDAVMAEASDVHGGATLKHGITVTDAEKKLISLAVIEFDGSAEDVIGRLGNESPDDWDTVVLEANKVNVGNLAQRK